MTPTPDRPRGPFCSVPGCVEPAEGAVLFAYVKEEKRFLCAAHLQPVRVALLKLLKVPAATPADPRRAVSGG
jgi:hypothetical protein